MDRVPHRAAVNEAVEMARPLAKEHGVAVQTRLEPGMPTVICDAILIGLVLINLIKNAIEASEHTEKKCVQVDVHHWGNSLRFEVIDFGEGISPEKKDSLYQPFYTTKPECERSGMGFAFMEAFMDEVLVESEVGRGTTVHMKKIIRR